MRKKVGRGKYTQSAQWSEKASTVITFDLRLERNERVSRRRRDEQVPSADVGACLACVRDDEVTVARRSPCGRGESAADERRWEWGGAQQCRPFCKDFGLSSE